MSMTSDFEWDPEKAQRNLRKHHIGFEEAITVFDDVQFITVLDEEHSIDEDRFITIGLSSKGRLLMVAHTERGNTVRIISAKRAT